MKQLLFTVTAKDCDWAYTKGTGAGGQKRNKTSSAVHCTHRASGAHAFAQDHREQRKNRELAFSRMAKSHKFLQWQKLEIARRTGKEIKSVEQTVSEQITPDNILVEYYDPQEVS